MASHRASRDVSGVGEVTRTILSGMAGTDTRLVLIRHGESRAQTDGFVSGHDTCTGLSDTGRAQAMALRDRLLSTRELGDVAAFYTSILPRAIETAELIAPAVGEIEALQECEWCEIHPGEAEGLSWDEVNERWPNRGTPFDPFARRMPGGETWAEFNVRAGVRLRRVADEHPGERVVVVCHGGVIGASFVALGDLALKSVGQFFVEVINTSITEWRWTDKQWRLVRFNDAAHLTGLNL